MPDESGVVHTRYNTEEEDGVVDCVAVTSG